MKVQYGDACLSQQQVYEWSRKFANDVTSVEDAPRPGQASFWNITGPEGPLSPVHNTQISYKIIFGLQSNQGDMDCCHQVSFCNMTMQGPHTARTTVVTITDLHFECLPHQPYSPDLAPSDFHMFGPLKEATG